MNDVVVMVERNRRNNLTTNFSRDQRRIQRSVLRFTVGSYIQQKMPFFVEVRGLKKIYELTGIGIGLTENFVRDGGVEEPYWGPSWMV